MTCGYTGKILRVNLSNSTVTVEEPSDNFYRKYMGGSALNLYYLLKEMPVGIDPLGPDNMLALSVGVTTGTPISGQSRLTVTAKSPLTGAIGDSQSGGFFPAKLKFAGFDAIIITGKASSPVYLWVHDGQVEIRKASHLWGQLTGPCQQTIRKELGDTKAEVLQIGPAGENRVRFAAIMSMCNRANGRTGMGAVMGSKNLKAIVAQGNTKPNLADKKSLNVLVRWGADAFPNSAAAGLGKFGTSEIINIQHEAGGLPSYNFNSGVFDGWKAIDGSTIYDTILKGREIKKQDRYGRDTCYGCIIRCKRVVEIKGGPFQVDPLYGGPEYESICTLGSYCGIDNLPAIAKANELCNKYGLDTMSTGATIAWAMEASEAGELTREDTGGLTLKFGDSETMVKLVEMIAKREGFGDILAEGSERASQRLDLGKEFLITSKSQEAPAHMPHVKRGLGLIYAVNPFGADHQSVEHDTAYESDYEFFKDRLALLGLDKQQEFLSLGSEKIRFVKKTQQLYSIMDSLCLCQFVFGPTWQLYGPDEMVQLVHAVTGWDVNIQELLLVGERRLNMMRAFNAREGFTKEHDTLPHKFFNRALEGGPTDGFKLDQALYESALSEYYRQVGWDEKSGIPKRETLEALDLNWVADDLKS
ncbi:MAG: aldehyde ferredoxin oxidoreductase family protein [Chloroflexi bacterium]|nr:aldehyde ferredoxin oxidoreductase family protein [Chloroflexota bacterium]